MILNFGLKLSLVAAGRSGEDYQPMTSSRLRQLSDIILTHLGDVLINATSFAGVNPTVDDLLSTGRSVIMPVEVTEFRQLSDYYWPDILSVDTRGRENPEDMFNQRSGVLEGYRRAGLEAGFLGSSLSVAITPNTRMIAGALSRKIELGSSNDYQEFEKNGLTSLISQYATKALHKLLDNKIDVSWVRLKNI